MIKRTWTICLFGASLFMLLASCETSTLSMSTCRTAETRDAFVSVPLIVEYDTIISQVVTDTSTFRATEENVDYANLRKWAVINCGRKYGCDVLVNPVYHISSKSGIVTIIVSGLPARYKRIRQATAADIWMLKFSEQ